MKCCVLNKIIACTANLIIFEGLFQVFQLFSRLKTVGSQFVTLNYYENGSSIQICQVTFPLIANKWHFSHAVSDITCGKQFADVAGAADVPPEKMLEDA